MKYSWEYPSDTDLATNARQTSNTCLTAYLNWEQLWIEIIFPARLVDDYRSFAAVALISSNTNPAMQNRTTETMVFSQEIGNCLSRCCDIVKWWRWGTEKVQKIVNVKRKLLIIKIEHIRNHYYKVYDVQWVHLVVHLFRCSAARPGIPSPELSGRVEYQFWSIHLISLWWCTK